MTGEKVLVVGGTGLIGAHAAMLLAERGDRVTLSSRSAVPEELGATLTALPHLVGDYVAGTFTEADLAPFDSVVFAAGNDVRHVDVSGESEEFWARAESEGVPAFVALAKRAGVARVIQLGSCYHQAMPELAAGSAYVRARQLADERSRALTEPGFAVITLNPPPIVGSIPGRVQRRFARLLSWLRGERDEPVFGPAGGTNYLSVRSLSQAIAGALDRGEPGHAYLVGDENLSYAAFYQGLADAAGIDITVEERDAEQPYQPDRFITQGRGNFLRYEPDAAETAVLGYDRNDIRRALAEIVGLVEAEGPSAPRRS
jgi:dihydroflavonol-4-reductase